MKQYKFAWWRLQHWPLLVLAVVTLVQVGRSLTNPGVELVPLWLRLVVVAGGVLMTGILVWGVAQFFASYLQLSSEGVGERRWPGRLKLVPWDKVENVRHFSSLGIFKSDILVYKRKLLGQSLRPARARSSRRSRIRCDRRSNLPRYRSYQVRLAQEESNERHRAW